MCSGIVDMLGAMLLPQDHQRHAATLEFFVHLRPVGHHRDQSAPRRSLATIADAVLGRLVHTAHRIALDGETLRKPPEKSAKRGKLDSDNGE
jgi:hypothetical protein